MQRGERVAGKRLRSPRTGRKGAADGLDARVVLRTVGSDADPTTPSSPARPFRRVPPRNGGFSTSASNPGEFPPCVDSLGDPADASRSNTSGNSIFQCSGASGGSAHLGAPPVVDLVPASLSLTSGNQGGIGTAPQLPVLMLRPSKMFAPLEERRHHQVAGQPDGLDVIDGLSPEVAHVAVGDRLVRLANPPPQCRYALDVLPPPHHLEAGLEERRVTLPVERLDLSISAKTCRHRATLASMRLNVESSTRHQYSRQCM